MGEAVKVEKGNEPGWLTSEEVARMLRVSRATLSRWRLDGVGPRFTRTTSSKGAPVRYFAGDIRALLDGEK